VAQSADLISLVCCRRYLVIVRAAARSCELLKVAVVAAQQGLDLLCVWEVLLVVRVGLLSGQGFIFVEVVGMGDRCARGTRIMVMVICV